MFALLLCTMKKSRRFSWMLFPSLETVGPLLPEFEDAFRHQPNHFKEEPNVDDGFARWKDGLLRNKLEHT